jgi:hypothetical protein
VWPTGWRGDRAGLRTYRTTTPYASGVAVAWRRWIALGLACKPICAVGRSASEVASALVLAQIVRRAAAKIHPRFAGQPRGCAFTYSVDAEPKNTGRLRTRYVFLRRRSRTSSRSLGAPRVKTKVGATKRMRRQETSGRHTAYRGIHDEPPTRNPTACAGLLT